MGIDGGFNSSVKMMSNLLSILKTYTLFVPVNTEKRMTMFESLIKTPTTVGYIGRFTPLMDLFKGLKEEF